MMQLANNQTWPAKARIMLNTARDKNGWLPRGG